MNEAGEVGLFLTTWGAIGLGWYLEGPPGALVGLFVGLVVTALAVTA